MVQIIWGASFSGVPRLNMSTHSPRSSTLPFSATYLGAHTHYSFSQPAGRFPFDTCQGSSSCKFSDDNVSRNANEVSAPTSSRSKFNCNETIRCGRCGAVWNIDVYKRRALRIKKELTWNQPSLIHLPGSIQVLYKVCAAHFNQWNTRGDTGDRRMSVYVGTFLSYVVHFSL